MQYTYETKKIIKAKKSKLIQKALEFFEENQPKENETFLVIKASVDTKEDIDVYGAYFGSECSPVDISAQKLMCREKAFLAEATDAEAMKSFIEKKSDKNLYLFKVKFEEFELKEITSFYGGKYELDVMISNA